MRDLIYFIEKKDKPILVHSNIKNPQKAIKSFKEILIKDGWFQ